MNKKKERPCLTLDFVVNDDFNSIFVQRLI
jgi:hypothetical protein